MNFLRLLFITSFFAPKFALSYDAEKYHYVEDKNSGCSDEIDGEIFHYKVTNKTIVEQVPVSRECMAKTMNNCKITDYSTKYNILAYNDDDIKKIIFYLFASSYPDARIMLTLEVPPRSSVSTDFTLNAFGLKIKGEVEPKDKVKIQWSLKKKKVCNIQNFGGAIIRKSQS